MILKLKNKLLNLNYKLFFLRIIQNLLKGSFSYLLTNYILGYSLFKPILVRSINYGMETITFNTIEETDYLFLICSPNEPGIKAGAAVNGFFKGLFNGSDAITQTQVFNGFTIGQIVVFGVTYGIIYYSLGLTQEYILPKVMRSVGWTNWYTDRERLNIILEGQMQNQQILGQHITTIINNQNIILTNIIQQLNNFEERLKNRLDFDFNASAAMLTSLRNTMLDLHRGQVHDIHDAVLRLQNQVLALNNLTADIHDRPVPNFHAELERINLLFTNFQSSLDSSYQSLIRDLQTQIQALESFDPNDLHTVTAQLRAIMSSMVQQAQQISEETNIVGEAIQTGVNRAEELNNLTNTVIVRNTSRELGQIGVDGSGSNIPPNSNIEATLAGLTGARIMTESAGTNTNNNVETTTLINQQQLSVQTSEAQMNALGNAINNIGNSGSFIMQQSSNGSFTLQFTFNGTNVPLENLSSNPISTHLTRQITNVATDMVVSTALTAGGSLIRGAFTGGLNGVVTAFGFAPVLRVLTSGATTQRALSSDHIERLAEAATAGETVGSGLGIAKTFVKSAWWVLKNS